MTALERAREFFAKDRFATQVMGIEIDCVDEKGAICSLTLDERHINAEGDIMGGVIFTLADFAFAVAANLDQPKTVTLSSQTTFLYPPRGKRLIAQAVQIRRGHNTCYYQVTILDCEGKDGNQTIVAMVGITGFIKRE